MYTRGSAIGSTWFISGNTSPNSSLIFTVQGGKRNLSSITRRHSPLNHPYFQTKQHIGIKIYDWVHDDCPTFSPNLVQFGLLPWGLDLEIFRTAEKRAKTFAKSSITQPRMAQLPSNLASWCVMVPQPAELLKYTSGQKQYGRQRVIKWGIWIRVSTPLAFEMASFRSVATTVGPPQIWCSSVPSSLRSRSSKSPAAKRMVKFTKSSITQPRVARLCWNLMRWCVVSSRGAE